MYNISMTDDGSIKYYNLNFPLKGEAGAWLDLHAPGGNFGFVIDFHTLLEHIHHAITGVDSLKKLQTVYKLKLNTISEALSITSFKVTTPRFLSSSDSHSAIGNEASYFSDISSYCEWNNPSSGYKLRLKKELERF